MKVKLFQKINSDKIMEMEGEINSWLEQNPNIKILNIQQSSNGGSFQHTKFYVSVWYE
jgi:hypothetical protein